MLQKTTASAQGYTRHEFNSIFQVYSSHVYSGLFKDFSFGEVRGRYLIAFREEAGKTPLLTIEKRVLGPDRVLFSAVNPDGREVARSEKLDSFVRQMRVFIEQIQMERAGKHASNKISYLK